MKILVVMKRFGANKDMVMQNFGRQIRLFEPLAKKHKIDFLCPDYVKKEDKIIKNKGIKYMIKPAGVFSIIGFFSYLKNLIRKERYGLVAATTDPLIGMLCYINSKKFKIPLLYDLQDNFEVYGAYKIPFVSCYHKKAVRNADIVLAASESLKKYISGLRKKPVYTIQNGIDLKMFKAVSKGEARKKLRLPLNAKIIVFIGALEKLKGFDVMIEAFKKVRQRYPNTYLLLSGKIGRGIDLRQKNIIFREFPKRKEVVLGINAADVAILPNPVNNFTKYCFPYKLAEYMACGVPIMATDVGDASLMLKNYHEGLCKPNDPDDLADKLINKLENYKRADYAKEIKQLDWAVLAKKLDNIVNNLSIK